MLVISNEKERVNQGTEPISKRAEPKSHEESFSRYRAWP